MDPRYSAVLVVDDDELVRQSIYNLLTINGFLPICVENGAIALTLSPEEMPPVVLIDLRLKDIPGLELLAEIKRRSPETECIVLTGYATKDAAIEAINLGAYGFIQKPCEAEHLLHMIRKAMEKREMADALKEERALLAKRVEERTAELRILNAELERSARIRDAFLATMSHELRTPLTSILGMAEALMEDVYGSLNADQIDSLRVIEKNGSHLLSLINDILDLSRLLTGELDIDAHAIDPRPICDHCAALAEELARKKSVRISVDYDGAVSSVTADETSLRRILTNLLENAVKFTEEGGSVGLTVRGDAVDGRVRFVVWDNGVGISEAEMRHLFKPFVQLDSGLSRRYSGTGLGLVLAQRLTEVNGGGLTVESVAGKGSVFTVSFPWQPDARSPSAGASVRPARPPALFPTPVHILMVEDDRANMKTISRYLRGKGARVSLADNGSEALDSVQREPPDLILMDIRMPEMDGLAAIRAIRQWESRKAPVAKADGNIPIIALTALTMPGDREKCLAAGADDYLDKPFSLKRLAETIRSMLGREAMPPMVPVRSESFLPFEES